MWDQTVRGTPRKGATKRSICLTLHRSTRKKNAHTHAHQSHQATQATRCKSGRPRRAPSGCAASRPPTQPSTTHASTPPQPSSPAAALPALTRSRALRCTPASLPAPSSSPAAPCWHRLGSHPAAVPHQPGPLLRQGWTLHWRAAGTGHGATGEWRQWAGYTHTYACVCMRACVLCVLLKRNTQPTPPTGAWLMLCVPRRMGTSSSCYLAPTPPAAPRTVASAWRSGYSSGVGAGGMRWAGGRGQVA